MSPHTINRIRELHAKGFGRTDIARLLHVKREEIAEALVGAPPVVVPDEVLQQEARLRAVKRQEVFEAELESGKWDQEVKDWWLRWGRNNAERELKRLAAKRKMSGRTLVEDAA